MPFLSLVKTNKEIQPQKRHLRELSRVPVRAGAGGMDQSLANGLLPSRSPLHFRFRVASGRLSLVPPAARFHFEVRKVLLSPRLS